VVQGGAFGVRGERVSPPKVKGKRQESKNLPHGVEKKKLDSGIEAGYIRKSLLRETCSLETK
jgi:hypothetical protein